MSELRRSKKIEPRFTRRSSLEEPRKNFLPEVRELGIDDATAVLLQESADRVEASITEMRGIVKLFESCAYSEPTEKQVRQAMVAITDYSDLFASITEANKDSLAYADTVTDAINRVTLPNQTTPSQKQLEASTDDNAPHTAKEKPSIITSRRDTARRYSIEGRLIEEYTPTWRNIQEAFDSQGVIARTNSMSMQLAIRELANPEQKAKIDDLLANFLLQTETLYSFEGDRVRKALTAQLGLLSNRLSPDEYTKEQQFLVSKNTPGAIYQELISTFHEVCDLPAHTNLRHYPIDFLTMARVVDISIRRAAVTALFRSDEDISLRTLSSGENKQERSE